MFYKISKRFLNRPSQRLKIFFISKKGLLFVPETVIIGIDQQAG